MKFGVKKLSTVYVYRTARNTFRFLEPFRLWSPVWRTDGST